MKGFYIEVSNDLLDPKHCNLMADSIWLFMWFLDKMTVIDHDKGEGKILGGKPIKYEDVMDDLGISRSTYMRWLGKLRKNNYIRLLRTPYGNVITVLKAKKRFKRSVDGKEYDMKEVSKKMSEDRKGENHYNWQGGITPENHALRNSLEMAQWRQAVFERDEYTCKSCGVAGGRLEADHINPFATNPELRFDVTNGQTLCKKCHAEKTKRDVSEMRHLKSGDESKVTQLNDENDTSDVRNRHISNTNLTHLIKTVSVDSTEDINIKRGAEAPPPPKKITPREQAESFFENVLKLVKKEPVPELQELLRQLHERNGIPKAVFWEEIKEFCAYWNERNSTGTKRRWEMQKTFEVDRRMTTWFRKSKFKEFNANFQHKPKGKTILV